MKVKYLNTILISAFLFTTGCSVFEPVGNTLTNIFKTEYEKFPREVTRKNTRFTLVDTGKIRLELPLIKGKTSCQTARKKYRVTFKSLTSRSQLTTSYHCELADKLVAQSKFYLRKGTYDIEVDYANERRLLDGNPILMAEFKNPNFASGEDQSLNGAVVLEVDKKIESIVDYSSGNQTNWFSIPGKHKMVTLSLASKNKASKIKAHVYRTGLGGNSSRKIGFLTLNQKKSFRLTDSNLYVKVMGDTMKDASTFSLLRTDANFSRAVMVPVIDSYRVGQNKAVVLLEVVEGLTLNSEVHLTGIKHNGERIAMGTCFVNSIKESQASCKMEEFPKQSVIEYNAKVLLEG